MVDNVAQKIYTFDQNSTGLNICGDPYPSIDSMNTNFNDSITTVDFTVNHTRSVLDLGFETNLNSDRGWWGLREIRVTMMLCDKSCKTCTNSCNKFMILSCMYWLWQFNNRTELDRGILRMPHWTDQAVNDLLYDNAVYNVCTRMYCWVLQQRSNWKVWIMPSSLSELLDWVQYCQSGMWILLGRVFQDKSFGLILLQLFGRMQCL